MKVLRQISWILMILLFSPSIVDAALRGGYIVQIAPNVEPPPGATAVYPEIGLYHLDNVGPSSNKQITWQNEDIRLEDVYKILPWYPAPEDWNLRWTLARQAQKVTKGKGIIVAVIDTGVGDHPELKGRILRSKGYDFVNEQAGGYDDRGHGTQVASLIAGTNLGVAPQAQILPLKFLDKNGIGSTADAIRAFRWAILQKARVINTSWGNPTFSSALRSAVEAAQNNQILTVAAAGNQAMDLKKSPNYPASFSLSGVIAVAATDVDDNLAKFSNFGSRVHLAAPGVDVPVAILGGGQSLASGTSLAAPAVSGTAALVLSLRSVTPSRLRSCLTATVDRPALPIASRGRINVLRAIQKCK